MFKFSLLCAEDLTSKIVGYSVNLQLCCIHMQWTVITCVFSWNCDSAISASPEGSSKIPGEALALNVC